MKQESVGNRILFAGLNTIDIQFLVARFPEANTKARAIYGDIFTGGPATNAAIACAYLGSKVDLLTPIGEHVFSEFIVADIKQFGIRILDPIEGFKGNPTLSGIITSQKNGDRTLIYYHPADDHAFISSVNLDIIVYKLVLFDGFFPELSIPVAEKCRQHGITTILDGGSWKRKTDELLDYVDVVICSSDFKVPGKKSTDSVFSYFQERGITYAAITRGEKSILYTQKNSVGETNIDQVEVVDTLGAGDIFHGAFCHYFGLEYKFTDSLKKASQIAGESCKNAWHTTMDEQNLPSQRPG